MKLLIDEHDFTRLKPETRADLLAVFTTPASASNLPNHDPRFDWAHVVDLTVEQVEQFMETASPTTRDGLKVVAKRGPVFLANELGAAGITNYGHFQGRVTQRTRTVTRKKKAYLFTWDDWSTGDNKVRGFGHYAVTRSHGTCAGYWRGCAGT